MTLAVRRRPPGFKLARRRAAIWGRVQEEPFQPPADRPLTRVAYECDLTTRAYVQTGGVGQPLPDMPLFLEPNGCILVPLETTYEAAFAKQRLPSCRTDGARC